MRKYITTIILVIIFLGLLAFFWFYESKKEEKKEEEPQIKTFVVWELSRDEITGLVFEHDGKTVNINKEPDGSWKILKPIEAKAKADKINGILDELTKIEGEGEEIPFENLSDFGLAPPKAKVTVQFSNGNNREIIFGDENPERTKIYAKVSDKNYVFLMSEVLFNKIKVSADELKE